MQQVFVQIYSQPRPFFAHYSFWQMVLLSRIIFLYPKVYFSEFLYQWSVVNSKFSVLLSKNVLNASLLLKGSFKLFTSRQTVIFSCVCVSCSVVSNSLQPHGLQPTRLFCPWNSPGKNTGVGCHALLHLFFLSQYFEDSNSLLLAFRRRQWPSFTFFLSFFSLSFTFMHWRRKWQRTPVFLLGKSQGWGSPVGCHLWGHTESDTTEATQQQQQQQLLLAFIVADVKSAVNLSPVNKHFGFSFWMLLK